MGYRSHYLMTFRKTDGLSFTQSETDELAAKLKKITDCEADDAEITVNGQAFIGIYDIKWYEWENDIQTLMKSLPGVELHLTREGEDHDDTERVLFKDGKWYAAGPRSFTPPVDDGTRVLVAWTDPKTATLHVDSVKNDHKEINSFRGPDGQVPVPLNRIVLFDQDFPYNVENPVRRTLSNDIEALIHSIDTIQHGRSIPYTSPSPCSTEVRLKQEIEQARLHLDLALASAKSLRY